MTKENNKIFSGDFLYLFKVQFLGAFNDNILKNAFIVLLAFYSSNIFNLPKSQMLNLASIIFITPFFIFSSYAGKLADSSDKAKLIQIIKLCEVIIMLIASISFKYHLVTLLLICLFLLGTHSAFFGPIKYSIVPNYLPRHSLVMANGYIEMGTFGAILLGQALGSWLMANGYMVGVVLLILMVSVSGYYFSKKLTSVPIANHEIKFYKNIFKDSWVMYKLVTNNRLISLNLHCISWFFALGMVFTTQFPILTIKYIGGNAHIFSLLLVIFTIGIGFGSLICAKLSNSTFKRKYVIIGAISISLGFFILLLTHIHPSRSYNNITSFINTVDGISLIINCLFIGLAGGFYSVTCYNEIQIISPENIRSQIISTNNVLNAVYMLVAMLVSSLLLTFVSVWWLLMITAVLNLVFVVLYVKFFPAILEGIKSRYMHA